MFSRLLLFFKLCKSLGARSVCYMGSSLGSNLLFHVSSFSKAKWMCASFMFSLFSAVIVRKCDGLWQIYLDVCTCMQFYVGAILCGFRIWGCWGARVCCVIVLLFF